MEMCKNFDLLATAVSESDVTRAKNMLKTNMLLQLDGTTPICEDIGRQMLCYGRRIPIAEMEERINSVTASDVKKVMQTYVYDQDPAVVAIGPVEALADYPTYRAWMAFWRF